MINEYLEELPIDTEDGNPLAYWAAKEQAGDCSLLVEIARRFLCIPIGTAASERSFKVARMATQDSNRERLLPQNLERLLFCRHAIRARGLNIGDLEPAPPDFDLPRQLEQDLLNEPNDLDEHVSSDDEHGPQPDAEATSLLNMLDEDEDEQSSDVGTLHIDID